MFDIYVSGLSSSQYLLGVEKYILCWYGKTWVHFEHSKHTEQNLTEHAQYLLRHFMKPIFRRKIGWKLSELEPRILEVKWKAEPGNGRLFFQVLQLWHQLPPSAAEQRQACLTEAEKGFDEQFWELQI